MAYSSLRGSSIRWSFSCFVFNGIGIEVHSIVVGARVVNMNLVNGWRARPTWNSTVRRPARTQTNNKYTQCTHKHTHTHDTGGGRPESAWVSSSVGVTDSHCSVPVPVSFSPSGHSTCMPIINIQKELRKAKHDEFGAPTLHTYRWVSAAAAKGGFW